MKIILLAATAALAMPALIQAQMTPAQTGAAGQMAPGTQADPATAPTDPNAPGSAPMQGGMAPGGAPMQGGMAQTPAGGYQPSGPAMQGTMTPGVQPTYQPAPSPSDAYPAPAPKASYPPCKKGQYDGCMERGGRK